MEPVFSFDRRQLRVILSIGLSLAVFGVFLLARRPVGSVFPFTSPLVVLAVGVSSVIGGVQQLRYALPMVKRWGQPPIELDSSGLTVLAAWHPPRRIEWRMITGFEQMKSGVLITLNDGATLTVDRDVVLMDGKRATVNHLAGYLAGELSRRLPK